MTYAKNKCVMNIGNSDDFKAQIKTWLRSRGIDYLWLAEQCGVSENTVRNWMAKAPIPPLKQKLLRKLIAQMPGQRVSGVEQAMLEVEPTISLNIRMATDVYDRLVLVAHRQGMDVGTMLNAMLSEMADKAEQGSGASVLLRNRKIVLPVGAASDSDEADAPQE